MGVRKSSAVRIFAAAAAAGILIFAVYLFVGNPSVWYHNQSLKKAVCGIAAGAEQKETVTLNEIVPFSWDKVYTFEPYTGREEIEKTIGFPSSSIRETVNEGMVQLLFVKGKKVTASVCGYPQSLGYDVIFNGDIAYADKAEFHAVRQSGIVRLTR